MKWIVAIAAVVMVAGCASYGAGSLVAGRSTAAEVEALMGAPAERLERPNGERVLYYLGARDTYAILLGADGLVRSVEPRLSKANIARLVGGMTTARELRELFGPPRMIVRMDRQQRDVWEYEFQHYEELRMLWVQLSYDGVVREVLDMLDWSKYPSYEAPSSN